MIEIANRLRPSDIGAWKESQQFAVERVIYSGRTRFQEVAIFKTSEFGTMLALDGLVQSAQDDEYIYHESLVHPAVSAHPEPRNLLVIGGGEGATLREALRHASISRVVMVDIDQELIELCKKHLESWHAHAFEDPRVQLVIADGQEFVAKTRESFDTVIIDITDALDDGPARALYTEAFYRMVKARLAESGLLVVQAMELTGLDYGGHLTVRRTLRRIFRHVNSYVVFVPSFSCTWGFVVASDAIDVAGMTREKVDAVLRSRALDSKLRFYDGQTHTHLFTLSKDIRAVLA